MLSDVPGESILVRHAWLLDANRWNLTSGPSDHQSVHQRGVWPVGNGLIFAHAGLAKPFNRLQGIVGPTYQTLGDHRVEGAFGECGVALYGSNGAIDLPVQRIWRPRRSGVLCTSGHGGRQGLVCVDYAPPDRPAIIRIIEVWGTDLPRGSQLVVSIPSARPSLVHDGMLVAEHRPSQTLVAGFVGQDVSSDRGKMSVDVDPDPSEIRRYVLVLATGAGEDAGRNVFEGMGDAVPGLLETQRYWRGWLESTTTPDIWPQTLPGPTSDVAVMEDLVELGKVNLKMQQALPGGAVSPMVHFKGVWARDSNGPIRAFLAMGAPAEAERILEYCYRAAILTGRIANSFPLDLDIDQGKEFDDWTSIPVEPVEVPSFIVLQHRWWLEGGGDPRLVERHWQYLIRCATGQEVGSNGLLRCHGDETYLRGALYSIVGNRLEGPSDLIDLPATGPLPWSLDSSIEYVATQEAMAWMAHRLGKESEASPYLEEAQRVRDAIETSFWIPKRAHYAPVLYERVRHEEPFAPINLRSVWLGYHSPSSERGRANLDAVVERIGFTGVTPRCGFNVGTTPAYLLWDLLEAKSDLAPQALANLVAMASPAGEWAEVYAPGGILTGGYSLEHPNRLRPWESGLALEAIMHYYRRRRAADEPLDPQPKVPRYSIATTHLT